MSNTTFPREAFQAMYADFCDQHPDTISFEMFCGLVQVVRNRVKTDRMRRDKKRPKKPAYSLVEPVRGLIESLLLQHGL